MMNSRDFFTEDDIDKIVRMMLAANWVWYDCESQVFCTPGSIQIRENMDHLLKEIELNPEMKRMSSGGIFVSRNANLIEVSFELMRSRIDPCNSSA
jgi:hypothetical protein